MPPCLLACARADPQSVLSWQRVRAASFLARDGQAWTDVIAQHNSGTGDNQWMVGGARGQEGLPRWEPFIAGWWAGAIEQQGLERGCAAVEFLTPQSCAHSLL